MSTLNIALADDRSTYLPGDVLAGVAAWQCEAPPESLELRLFWYTRGKGDADVVIAQTIPIENPGATGNQAFQFTLPDAPYSFSGKLISLIWALELVVKPHAEAARQEITLSPDGQEILLCGEARAT